MTCKMFEDVRAFHRKFKLAPRASYSHLPTGDDLLAYRSAFLAEELAEFDVAVETDDVVGALDALIDLVYVALGTADLCGMSGVWEAAWDEVQRANLAKRRVASAAESGRGSTYDVVKPPGWRPPDVAGIVAAARVPRRNEGGSKQ